jgi:hypothetical protein
MRPDMKKVVTERPRVGGGYKSPKGDMRAWSRYDAEETPKREAIRRKWQSGPGGKVFTDVLGPLYRYLLKQVGRPWDKVYSEIAQNLPKTSVQNRHVYTHVWQFVEKDVVILDGVPCYNGGGAHGRPLYANRRYQQLYVHPVTGLLCRARKRYPAHTPPRIEPGIKVYPGVQYHKLDGVWYEVIVRPHPRTVEMPGNLRYPLSIVDTVLQRRYVSLQELVHVYGGYYIAVSKRRLTRREIRAACLK